MPEEGARLREGVQVYRRCRVTLGRDISISVRNLRARVTSWTGRSLANFNRNINFS